MVVWTDYQTAGRGCGTNSWESERGQNLLFSLLIHPAEIKAAHQFRISMAISLAIVDTLTNYVDEGLSIKWPNDIYWHDRKLGGILIENSLAGDQIRDCIIGVGLNINQQCFRSDAPNPVSLSQITGHEVERDDVLREVLRRFTLDVAPNRYRQLLYRREGYHRFVDGMGFFEAKIVDVEDSGQLVVEDTKGLTRRYAFKEVQFVI